MNPALKLRSREITCLFQDHTKQLETELGVDPTLLSITLSFPSVGGCGSKPDDGVRRTGNWTE